MAERISPSALHRSHSGCARRYSCRSIFHRFEFPVPAFIIQPLVENAVRHAMPAEGKLNIRIETELVDVPLMRQSARTGESVVARTHPALVIRVIDDGIGMSQETCDNIMHPESSTGLGIAVKNVADRIKGYFGPESSMQVDSALGEGTTVTLTLFLDNQ